jgi:hypothetical protein
VAAQNIQLGRERQNAVSVTRGLPDYHAGFSFCRLEYDRTRSLRSGLGWSTDYPSADHNFLTRLEELTTTPISFWVGGDPGYASVRATDPDLFRCPFLFMSDPGSYDFSPREVERLRAYFAKGGFLWADDLWDDQGGWIYLQRKPGAYPSRPPDRRADPRPPALFGSLHSAENSADTSTSVLVPRRANLRGARRHG